MSKIFNNKIIWFNYEPGAGGDFLLGTLFNLAEIDTVFKEYNKYGSFYFDQTIEKFPFYTISNVKTINGVNKVKEYINNTKLSYISSHTPPTLIYPLLENPKKLLNVFIYADSLTIERYLFIILGIKHPEFWPSGVNQQLSIMGNTATDVGMMLAISKLKSQTTFGLGPAQLCIAVGNGFEIYNDYACTQLDWTEDGYRNLNKEFLRNTDLMDIWTMQTDRYVKHSKYAETLPSHYEYLKKNVYK